ncbi:acetylxylan esterase [Kineosporia sp. A_224]|uniref:acetylxylan esterase n=1 Tax=Kineosporia sp. A_224 TaxID=1962180 RepID=UPI000B4AA763|nr:acetylxylan esterase [Kineosporia sp. A_224]
MPWTDLPLDELREFRSAVAPAADVQEFWADRLATARAAATPVTSAPVDSPLTRISVQDLEFSGAEGHRIKAWLLTPVGVEAPLPCLVQYIGYGGGRSLAHEWTLWPSAGWATLVMDTRGQGWADTPDPGYAANPQTSGFVTRGILDPSTQYYARVFVDAARAVDVARELPGIDAARVAVGGGSQGGAITIGASALVPDVLGSLVGVPFWCDVERASTLVAGDPYNELAFYLKARPYDLDAVRRTLSYVDGVVLAGLATSPALFEIGLMDDICPPSTCYAAYNAWAGPKEVREYHWSGHEGGDSHHTLVALRWLDELAGRAG